MLMWRIHVLKNHTSGEAFSSFSWRETCDWGGKCYSEFLLNVGIPKNQNDEKELPEDTVLPEECKNI